MHKPRRPDWEDQLAQTIAAWWNRRHRPATGQDCAAFAAACVAAVVGVDVWPADLPAYRSLGGQRRALRRAGWRNLVDAADACIGDAIPPLAAHRGDIVSDGTVLAVMTARGALAFGEGGMAVLDPASLVAAWIVGRADAPAGGPAGDGEAG